MFKPSKWRGEKHKVKVVFKLQFHATQVPQLAKKDTLMVSLVPVDVGKPSVRLEKSVVQEGTCRWENPVYETVKFIEESKTGRINDKIYQFVVSTGSSKASVIGDVSVNFADYFEAIKASSVSIPLKAQNSGAVLHFTIQRMHGDVDHSRDIEENGNATIEQADKSLRRKFSDSETDENKNYNSFDTVSQGVFVDKATSQSSEFNGNLVKCQSADAISGSGSESSSGPYTPQELGLRNTIVRRASGSFLSSLNQTSVPQKPISNAIITNYLQHQRSNTDWSVGSAPEGSADDSTNSSDDNLVKDKLPYSSDVSMEKLKHDVVTMARQAEVSELELQTLRKQVVKESKRGHELSREVVSLKEERDALKQECQQLKALHKRSSKSELESDEPYALLREVRRELELEKDVNGNLRVQLQKTQESNSELLLAVQELDEMLEQKNREISHLSSKSAVVRVSEKTKEVVGSREMDEDEEQRALESLIKEHSDAKEAYLLEQRIIDLYSEIEVYRRDRDELEMQMEQLALDYEILKQENHDILSRLEQNHLQEQLKSQYEGSECSASMNELESQVESLQDELKKREEDFSASLVTVSELKSQVESLQDELGKRKAEFSTSLVTVDELKSRVECLENELEEQERVFEADLDAVMHAKIEQEKRAIRAEEALRKTRLSNGSTAERLQEEFRRLSSQMTSTFDANEKLAKKAMMEAYELRMQKSRLEEMLEKVNEDVTSVKEHYEEKLKDLSCQMDLAKNEVLILRDEVIKLTEANDKLSEQAELAESLQVEIEKLRTSITELELVLQKSDAEKHDLEKKVSLVTTEADDTVGVLQSEVESLKAECDKLKRSVFENKMEKENLRKQIRNLKSDLTKMEEIIATNEKNDKNDDDVRARDSKDFARLQERIIQLEEQIGLKEVALENSSNLFLEKEKNLWYKIEELEQKTAELDNSSKRCCEDHVQKEVENTENSGDSKVEKAPSSQNSTKSTNKISLNKLLIATSYDGDHREFDELLSEMALMKEKNETMRDELKEMQERYSEISLKFAEVEGERQQLVMTVRNLKKS